MIRRTVSAALLFAALSVPALAAPASQTIGFMGILNTASGVRANGNVAVTLSLYAEPTGGTAVWSEDQAVTAANGLFSTALGRVNPLAAVDFSQALFVGIKVSGDAAELLPRIPLNSVPYAMFAQTVADGSVSAPKLATDAASLGKVSGGVMTNLGTGTTPFIGINAAPDRPLAIGGAGGNGEWLSLLGPAGGHNWHVNNLGGGLNVAETTIADGRLYLAPGGNVGIGTTSPQDALDVRGSIRLGYGGQYYAAGGNVAQRIVFGAYSQETGIYAGTGFTVTKQGVGDFLITYTPPFHGYPAVTVTPESKANAIIATSDGLIGTTEFFFRTTSGIPTDPPYFNFIAIGKQ